MGGRTLALWSVQAGIFLSMLGYGAVLPFEVIYLHDGRGFDLGVAGLIVGTMTGLAVVVAPLAGSVIDRVGARRTGACAGLALAAGYGALAIATTPAGAFGAAALAGIGNGGLQPSQSTLIVSLAPPHLRHRAVAVSRVAANVGMGVGAAIGGLVATRGFVPLLLANAATYLIYVAIFVVAVRERARPEPVAGGYRRLLGDRLFLRLVAINVAVIAVGWGVFTWIVPPYARAEIGVGTPLLGLLLTANAVTVVVVQIPIARLAEGRRRAPTLMIAAGTFATACGLVLFNAPFALLAAAIVFGVGECLHTTVVSPLVADLAPPALRGRYLATLGVSFWLGLALAPVLGTQLLSVSPPAALLVPAAVVLAAGWAARGLELPTSVRLTPRLDSPVGGDARMRTWTRR